jgi:serine protease Do
MNIVGRSLFVLAMACTVMTFIPASYSAAAPKSAMPPGNAPMSFSSLVENVRPAVVSIYVTGSKVSKAHPKTGKKFKGFPDLPKDHPFNEFFRDFGFNGGVPKRKRRFRAEGSGFIISEDGYVVTNHHVIDESQKIKISMQDGKRYDATLVGSDERTDVALLKISKDMKFPYVKFSNDPVKVGDWVLAMGNPFGLGGTVTAGIVSARGREVGSGPYDFIQIDAAVNKGNSGGPTFNLKGEVVGVNTAIYSPSGGNVGIAFAVPADTTESVIKQIRQSGSVQRGWLGVSIQDVDEDMAEGLGLSEAKGSLVAKIVEDGPAAKSKLRAGDVIVKVNEEAVEDSRDLARKIAALSPKSDARITVVRNDGKEKEITVKLGRFPGSKKLASIRSGEDTQGEELKSLGMTLAPASEFKDAGNEGVVITNVEEDSNAAEKGIRSGDIILEMGGEKVSSPADVLAGVRKAKKQGRGAVFMLIKAGKRQRFMALPIDDD